MTTVLFAGGGTGGHLMPALAIAEAMVALEPAVQPFFVGGLRGVEARVLPARPWPFELLPLEPIYRRQWWRNARLPFSLWRSLQGVRRVLLAEQPALVVGTGGYVSGPVVWAAMNRGIPAVLQEQNAFPGLATRWLARRADQVHLGFEEAIGRLPRRVRTANERTANDEQGQPEAHAETQTGTAPSTVRGIFATGNPILPPPAPRPDRSRAKRNFGFPKDRPLVLLFGGSQGAAAVNQVVAGALQGSHWPADVSLLWQTGQAGADRYRSLENPGRVRVTPFIDPMADAYAAADLVVARAGAMSLAEICAWGLPSVLVPLPSAAANHQHINAVALVEAGASLLLEQRSLTAHSLVTTVAGLLGEPAKMADMAARAVGRGRANAATDIARMALSLVRIS